MLRSTARNRLLAAAALGVLVVGGPAAVAAQSGSLPHTDCSTDWPAAWHDAAHTSSVRGMCTSITPLNVAALAPAWVTPASNVVTASPVVVGDTVYVGDWDGIFTAYDVATGKVKWQFTISATAPVYPGLIVSTATVTSFPDPAGVDGQRLVVLFGGGSSLWALDAATGKQLARVDLDPRTAATKAAEAAAGQNPQVNVESSPAVADVSVGGAQDRRIYVGMDVHDDAGVGRTGVIALHLVRGDTGWSLDPIWKLDAETGEVYSGTAGLTANSGTGFGCGGVWSSPAVDVEDNLVTFGTASCSHAEDAQAAGANWSERMVAARADTGHIVWAFRPAKTVAEAHLDDDFGASANVFTTESGAHLIGEGRKSGCYYAKYAANGAPAWRNCTATAGHIGDQFAIGGYLGTTAVQTDSRGRALRIIGATAVAVPHKAGEVPNATVVVRAMDASTGKTLWTYRLAGPTYSSVSVAGDIVFVPDTFSSTLIALDGRFGVPLAVRPIAGPPSSTLTVSGGSVFLAAGTSESGIPGLNKTGAVYRLSLPAALLSS
ncbi:MAG: PQQ-binding-like beta-propeller repeat protein [Actinomycetes bacterium]